MFKHSEKNNFPHKSVKAPEAEKMPQGDMPSQQKTVAVRAMLEPFFIDFFELTSELGKAEKEEYLELAIGEIRQKLAEIRDCE